jgi:hypothetical protein
MSARSTSSWLVVHTNKSPELVPDAGATYRYCVGRAFMAADVSCVALRIDHPAMRCFKILSALVFAALVLAPTIQNVVSPSVPHVLSFVLTTHAVLHDLERVSALRVPANDYERLPVFWCSRTRRRCHHHRQRMDSVAAGLINAQDTQ